VLTGYISSAGKLVLPAKTVASTGVILNTTLFKVGMDEGKRKAKSLYLVPASSGPEAFSFEKAAKSYTLVLPFILKKSGVDFSTTNMTLPSICSSTKVTRLLSYAWLFRKLRRKYSIPESHAAVSQNRTKLPTNVN
jgi:hypothetical protein